MQRTISAAGLTTAIMLAQRGWTGITVFDKRASPPHADSDVSSQHPTLINLGKSRGLIFHLPTKVKHLDLIAVSIRFEYDSEELAARIASELVP